MAVELRDARLVAVIGPSEASAEELEQAEEVGALLAEAHFWVLTGGLGGVMEAASRGAKSRRGHTVGLLPGTEPADANGWVDLALPTGLGELRNGLLARAAIGVIAVGQGHGTLTEIGFALGSGRPVLGVATWAVHGVTQVDTASEAVEGLARLLSQ
ncbi:MAG: LOG family protein [Solirubrobacterales bacterium]|nr:LOG family protein [Solirubrobacterales bacterium]